MKELVSVVIPVRNRPGMLEEAISSVLAQTYSELELIIGDNASTDETYECAMRYARNDSRIRVIRQQENIGVYPNTRTCVEAAQGRFVKIVWSDDLIVPSAIERLQEAMREDTAFVYSAAELIGGARSVVYSNPNRPELSADEFIRGFFTGEPEVPVSPGCALVRRDVACRALSGNYCSRALASASAKFGPDLFILLEAFRERRNVRHIAEPLAKFRVHAGSITIAERSRAPVSGYLGAFGELAIRLDEQDHLRTEIETQLAAWCMFDWRLALEWRLGAGALLEESLWSVLKDIPRLQFAKATASVAKLRMRLAWEKRVLHRL